MSPMHSNMHCEWNIVMADSSAASALTPHASAFMTMKMNVTVQRFCLLCAILKYVTQFELMLFQVS